MRWQCRLLCVTLLAVAACQWQTVRAFVVVVVLMALFSSMHVSLCDLQYYTNNVHFLYRWLQTWPPSSQTSGVAASPGARLVSLFVLI